MKKYIGIFLIFLCLILVLFFTNKDNKNNKKIKLAEVTHSVFYTPLYVAIEKGYFKENNIDLELILTSGADKVSAAVLSGDVQIGLAGAESAIYIYNGGEKDYLKIFSGLTKRDGQFILGRKKDNNFSLEDLKNKEVLVGRKGGMPSLNFINALKNNNIDINKVNINYDIDFASLSGAFISGNGDYVNLFEPNASLLKKNKDGYILASIGQYSGEMPYTTFYARKSFIDKNETLIKNFVKSISQGLEYTNTHSAKEIAKVIKKQFPDNNLEDLEIMIQNYKDADTWLNNTYISKTSLDNLQKLLYENKLIDNYVSYKKIIVNYESRK